MNSSDIVYYGCNAVGKHQLGIYAAGLLIPSLQARLKDELLSLTDQYHQAQQELVAAEAKLREKGAMEQEIALLAEQDRGRGQRAVERSVRTSLAAWLHRKGVGAAGAFSSGLHSP